MMHDIFVSLWSQNAELIKNNLVKIPNIKLSLILIIYLVKREIDKQIIREKIEIGEEDSQKRVENEKVEEENETQIVGEREEIERQNEGEIDEKEKEKEDSH